jgi:peptide deformylase
MDNNPKTPDIIRVNRDDLRCVNSLLRTISRPASEQDDIMAIIDRMRYVLSRIEYGAGLSAIQIGIPLRIAIVNIKKTATSEIVLINPTVISLSGRPTYRTEGCLSLPHYKGPVKRKDKISIKTLNLHWQETVLDSRGYEAAVIQHELDHMDGLFYWDRMDFNKFPEPLTRGEHGARQPD